MIELNEADQDVRCKYAAKEDVPHMLFGLSVPLILFDIAMFDLRPLGSFPR